MKASNVAAVICSVALAFLLMELALQQWQQAVLAFLLFITAFQLWKAQRTIEVCLNEVTTLLELLRKRP